MGRKKIKRAKCIVGPTSIKSDGGPDEVRFWLTPSHRSTPNFFYYYYNKMGKGPQF